MSFGRKCAVLTSTLFFTGALVAADVDNNDIQALRDWINSKRMITVRELGGQLSISGEVRAEMQAMAETRNGVAQRGRGTGRPTHSYDIEFNLGIDYRTENTWAAARIRFDNDAGIQQEYFGSGTNNRLKIDKAYFGYRLIDRDRHTTDIEVGRRGMFALFDSKLQFGSNFDGVNVKDSYALEKVGDLYYQLGAFVVNERKNQAGYIGEVGILNVAGTGFYTKYSLIDWDTKNDIKIPEEFHFINSQLLLGYKYIPQPWDKIVNVYLGGVYNHRARRLVISDRKKANYAGWLGFGIGQIKQQGDWAFETNYQVVAAQSIPSFDILGVGMGNSVGNGFYYTRTTGGTCTTAPCPNTRRNAEGNVNYRGFRMTLQYMLTNNLNLFQEWSQSITLDDHIGPFRRYKQYELELIYAF
jgi:hypothetical protein